jgi:hypothetical protein
MTIPPQLLADLDSYTGPASITTNDVDSEWFIGVFCRSIAERGETTVPDDLALWAMARRWSGRNAERLQDMYDDVRWTIAYLRQHGLTRDAGSRP